MDNIDRERDTRVHTANDPRVHTTTGDPRVHTTTTTATHRRHRAGFNGLDWIALILMIIGGLNWGLVGLFGLDLVAVLFGVGTIVARIVYILVGLAAIWGFAMFRHGRRDSY